MCPAARPANRRRSTRPSIAASIEACVEEAAGRVPVIAGCGSNDTAHRDRTDPRREGSRRRRRACTCRLITTAPTRRASTPISPRSPRRSTCRSSSTTCRRARSPTSRSRRWRGSREIANVVGVKDATGNLARVSAQRLACGADFVQLSGNDDMALGFNAMGGVGLHLGHRQCRAAALRRFPECLPCRRLGRGA